MPTTGTVAVMYAYTLSFASALNRTATPLDETTGAPGEPAVTCTCCWLKRPSALVAVTLNAYVTPAVGSVPDGSVSTLEVALDRYVLLKLQALPKSAPVDATTHDHANVNTEVREFSS